MSTLHAVANAFWPVIEDQEVADVAFSHVTHFGFRPEKTATSTSVAARYYKGELGHAQSIAANPYSDAAILRRFAKDTRVSVRQALLTNPSTPPDVVVDLLVWSIKRCDRLPEEAFAALSLTDVTTAFERASILAQEETRRSDTRFALIAERCVSEPHLAVPLARTGAQGLTVQLAHLAHTAQLRGVSLTMITEADPQSTEAILTKLLAERTSLTIELATLWLTWSSNPETRSYRHFGHSLDSFTVVEAGAANVLIPGGQALLVTGMVHGGDDDLLIKRVAESTIEELGAIVEALTHCEVSANCEEAIATRLTWLRRANNPRLPVQRMLESFKHPLAETILLGVLRTGSPEITAWWLQRTDIPCGPRNGMLRALHDNPGRAIESDNQGGSGHNVSLVRSSELAAATNLPELFDEVIELHDDWIGCNLHNRDAATVVYPTLRRSFAGTQHKVAWETFFSLAADWSDSFTQLLLTVRELNGLEDVNTGANTSQGAAQLTLL